MLISIYSQVIFGIGITLALAALLAIYVTSLEIELPRDLIDSKTKSDTDKPYSVFEDDIDRPISFIESRTTDQARTLVITFNSEDNVLEIQGTEVLSKPGGEF
jgi:hypothetical protein